MPFSFGLDPLNRCILFAQWRSNGYREKIIFCLSALFIGSLIAVNLVIPLTLDHLRGRLLDHQLSSVPMLTLTSPERMPWDTPLKQALSHLPRLSEQPWYPIAKAKLILIHKGQPYLVDAEASFPTRPIVATEDASTAQLASASVGIAVDSRLANRLNLEIGAMVWLCAVRSTAGELQVTGLLEIPILGYHFAPSRGVHYNITLPHETFFELTGNDSQQIGQWGCSEVSCQDKHFKSLQVKADSETGKGWRCQTWMDLSPVVARALEIEVNLFRALVTAMTLLALLGLSILTHLYVMKQAKSLTILRVLGASRKQLLTLMCLEFAMPTLCGCLLSIPMTASLICMAGCFLDTHGWMRLSSPTLWGQFSLHYLLIPITILLLNFFLVSFYPIWQLSQLPPDPIFEE